jgi:hypothetical protein
VYDELDCGQTFAVEKGAGKDAYTLLGFDGPTIRIRIFEAWSGNLAQRASEIESAPNVQLLTAIEPFSIGGQPAVRHIYRIRAQEDAEYIKVAFAAFDGKLHMFQYNHMDLYGCDAPPLSEEAVYEHLLSTLEFVP